MVTKIKSISFIDQNEMVSFSSYCQTAKKYPELIKNSTIVNGLNSFKKRGQYGNLVVILNSNLEKEDGLDIECNVWFQNKYLDELPKLKKLWIRR